MLKKLKALNAYLLFYPTLLWTIFLGRVIGARSWWDEIDEHVILGAIPLATDVEKLHELGVGCIINLCAESSGPVALYKKYNIDYFNLPTADFTCPDLSTIKQGVSLIKGREEKGVKVYVHCKAGRGRSASIVFCWLVNDRQLSMEEAMNLLISKRPHVNRRIHERKFVKEYLELNSKD